MDQTTRHCPTCGEERLFEQPPCPDGHGADCPEWACTVCGSALLVGFTVGPREAKAGEPSRAA